MADLEKRDSRIDIAISSPLQAKASKKSVKWNETTEVYMRSPQSYTNTPQSTVRSAPLIPTSLASHHPNSPNSALITPHPAAVVVAAPAPLPIRRAQDPHSRHIALKQYQYAFLIQTKIWHALWSLLHVFFEIFLLTVLIYTVSTAKSVQKIDGFTIYLFVSTCFHLLTIFVGVISSTGTELMKQIYASVLGISCIIQLVTTCLFLFLFRQLVAEMKQTSLATDVAEPQSPPVLVVNSLISLYDILSSFYILFAILHVLIFFGIIIGLINVKFQIKYLYHDPPTEKITLHGIINSWKTRNDAAHLPCPTPPSLPFTNISATTSQQSTHVPSEIPVPPTHLIIDGIAVQSPFSPLSKPIHINNEEDEKSTELTRI
jgi:hypothetical protein